jgi:hypothetical protein
MRGMGVDVERRGDARRGGLADAVLSRDGVEPLLSGLDRVIGVPVDELDEPALEAELGMIETVVRRLDARRCRVVDALAARQARRAAQAARETGRDEHRAAEQARRDTGRRIGRNQQWAPWETKRNLEVGRRMRDPGPAQEAFDAGRLSPRHVKLLADTLACLDGDTREEAERMLLAAAETEDATAFGRTCRRLLAELDHEAAAEAEARRHERRRAALATTEDGMLAFSGQLSGVDAETFATAVDAFRTPDGPGQYRTAEQATADAMVEMAQVALRSGEAPEQHGVRPHVLVTIDHESILAEAGVATTTWMGPLPYAEIRRLLADCGVSRLLTDPAGVPVEAGKEIRDIPAGLWRAVLVRDKGCIAEGCQVPPGWCDVMHLEGPYRLGGPLVLEEAALGCRRHHRLFDDHGWRVEWSDGRPVMRPPPPS